jgi:hypothetical protein
MAGLDPRRLVGNPGAPAYTGPVLADQTSTIGGPVGRSVTGGYGGVTPIQAHGAGIPADLYGLHQGPTTGCGLRRIWLVCGPIS